MPGLLRLFLSLIVLGLGSACLLAADAGSPAADFDALLKQLDADQFAERQSASDELSRLGSSAFPALEKAAKSDSREASERAVDILKKHFQGDDTVTKQAAKESLERLAADPASRSGRLADLVLNPPPPPTQIAPGGVIRPAMRVAGANIRVNAAPIRFAKRIHVRNNNGVKEIEVEENGRKVKVVDDPKEGLQLEVTEKKNGKETTEKYQAKNAEELKQKHPEAYKIYDEVSKQNGGVQIQIGGIELKPNAPNPPAQPAPADDAKAKEQRLEAMKRTVQTIDQHIEQLRRQFPDRPDVQRHIERLEEHRKQLQKLEAE
jgi:hypothetical protein